jgi:putative oxidoreductase
MMTATLANARPASGFRPRLSTVLDRLGRVPASLHLLLFRLAVAGVFFRAGQTKWASWESTVALFAEEYKVPVFAPAMAAALATTFELGCSTLLVPQAWGEHLTWGSILLLLLTRGPGAVSLDRAIGLDPGDTGR